MIALVSCLISPPSASTSRGSEHSLSSSSINSGRMVICFSFHLPLHPVFRLTTYTKYFTPSFLVLGGQLLNPRAIGSGEVLQSIHAAYIHRLDMKQSMHVLQNSKEAKKTPMLKTGVGPHYPVKREGGLEQTRVYGHAVVYANTDRADGRVEAILPELGVFGKRPKSTGQYHHS